MLFLCNYFHILFQFKPSAEVSGEVADATFRDTSIERPLLLFKMAISKGSGFPLR